MGFFVLAGCRGAAPDPATEGTLCVLATAFRHTLLAMYKWRP